VQFSRSRDDNHTVKTTRSYLSRTGIKVTLDGNRCAKSDFTLECRRSPFAARESLDMLLIVVAAPRRKLYHPCPSSSFAFKGQRPEALARQSEHHAYSFGCIFSSRSFWALCRAHSCQSVRTPSQALAVAWSTC